MRLSFKSGSSKINSPKVKLKWSGYLSYNMFKPKRFFANKMNMELVLNH